MHHALTPLLHILSCASPHYKETTLLHQIQKGNPQKETDEIHSCRAGPGKQSPRSSPMPSILESTWSPLEGIAARWDPSSPSAPSIFVSRDACSSYLNVVLSLTSLPPSNIVHSKTLGSAHGPGSRVPTLPPMPRSRHHHTTSPPTWGPCPHLLHLPQIRVR
jgi:hypothetical protein